MFVLLFFAAVIFIYVKSFEEEFSDENTHELQVILIAIGAIFLLYIIISIAMGV